MEDGEFRVYDGEENRTEQNRTEATELYLSDFKLSGNNWLRLSGFATTGGL